ncbi:ABC transporter substrate-binding protein [Thalassospira sp. MCCC 1A03138]|uniref:ABC transporter substrate-binding protein n=1 Tax=Thalassospira sp. MCCC 1A03138 TaxID=1470576 RepID=UPI000A1FE1C6|nr:ABC transporter substrate-binding protein [Thalassospira sp. MCCC 1A03138]OSQ28538.1 ABC transporter substrate-binding protein [Thalassospira sp. MCCC 1A03138]
MTGLFKTLATAVGLAAMVATPIIATAADLPSNVRLVIGSKSTGGDTYQNSAIIAEALSKKLDINVKVDAVGVSEAFKALDRDSRGTTLMMFHDGAYMGNLYGVRGYDDIFEKYNVGATVSINPGNAYLVAKDSPFRSMEDVFAAAAAGQRIRVAIQAGGVSEIGLSAMKNAAKIMYPGAEENIVAVNTGSQADKNQLLFDRQADVINGSVQANEQFTQLPQDDQKAMRFIWVTAREKTIKQANPEGMGNTTSEELLGYTTPNVSVTMDGTNDFTFDKEFFFLFNKDMDPAIIETIDNALTEIYAEGKIQETQKNSFFIPNFLPSKEASAYLKDKSETIRKIISSISTQ